jgi:hypothetical protein
LFLLFLYFVYFFSHVYSPVTLTSTLLPRASLSEADAAAMLALFDLYYENVRPERFRADLAEKEWVVLLRDGGRIAGFSTARLIEAAGRRAVFSGDTIVARDYWDRPELPRAWGRFVMSMAPIWWFLISKGVRTYLYLPLYFRDFWPRHDRATPADAQSTIDAFARAKYPAEYRDGLIRCSEPHGNLRPEFAAIPSHRAVDAHARFFVERNPDFARGTELACLAEVREENLTPAARRMVGLARVR